MPSQLTGYFAAAHLLCHCLSLFCRLGTIALLFLPVIGWVGFNILQPALNQLNRQAEIKEEASGSTSRKSSKPSKRR
jgi:hypothetical protein